MFEKRRIDKLDSVRYVTCARISSPKQDLASQVSEIKGWCNKVAPRNFVSKGHFEECISTMKNWRMRKDSMLKIMGLAKGNQIDHVIFYSIFRLGRSQLENHEIAEELRQCGVSMFFVRENVYYGDGATQADKIIFSLMSSLAEIDRDRKVDQGVRGYRQWRKKNPDKIWGTQPKVRGKKLELLIAMYEAEKPISRPWDKRRQPSSTGMTAKFSYRQMAEVLKIDKTTVGRYIKNMVRTGQMKPRQCDAAKFEHLLEQVHISPEVKKHAEDMLVKGTKRKKFVDVDGEAITREVDIYMENGEMHPSYADDTLGPFSKPLNDVESEDTMEFMTLYG